MYRNKNSSVLLFKEFDEISIIFYNNVNIIQNNVGDYYIISSAGAFQCNRNKINQL